jgi:hypothetical protein
MISGFGRLGSPVKPSFANRYRKKDGSPVTLPPPPTLSFIHKQLRTMLGNSQFIQYELPRKLGSQMVLWYDYMKVSTENGETLAIEFWKKDSQGEHSRKILSLNQTEANDQSLWSEADIRLASEIYGQGRLTERYG